jgi:hypothetical protein
VKLALDERTPLSNVHGTTKDRLDVVEDSFYVLLIGAEAKEDGQHVSFVVFILRC